MATEASGVAVTTPTDVGLKRELGLIGATWASETSIIGSGWLFGSLFAAQLVGGAAVLAWAIAGVVVVILGLTYAELGAMYPVSGGTGRFPHFAFGSGLIDVTGTSRVSYGLARNRYFPQVFDKTNSNGVPWFGVLAAFVIGLFFLLPFPSWHSLVGLITGASVLMYAGGPLSMGAFRGQVPDANRPYRMPAAAVLCPLAFIVADLLIYWSGFEVVWKLGVVLVIGYVIMGILMALDPQRPPLDWKNAIWMPVWLIGMGIISWQGQFSGQSSKTPKPPVNTGNLGFWWDILAVAGFSVVIYYWAMRTKLPREEMLLLVNKQAGHGDDPMADIHH